MASPSVFTSLPVALTNPRYSGVHPETDSCDIITDVLEGRLRGGASVDVGGVSGWDSRTCKGVLGNTVVVSPYDESNQIDERQYNGHMSMY